MTEFLVRIGYKSGNTIEAWFTEFELDWRDR